MRHLMNSLPEIIEDMIHCSNNLCGLQLAYNWPTEIVSPLEIRETTFFYIISGEQNIGNNLLTIKKSTSQIHLGQTIHNSS